MPTSLIIILVIITILAIIGLIDNHKAKKRDKELTDAWNKTRDVC